MAKTIYGKFETTILATDPNLDVALTKTKFKPTKFAVFRAGKSIRPGDDVLVFGYPFQDILTDQGNVTIGSVSALAGVQNDTTQLQISAPVQPGNSGGPVFDSTGATVGIVVSRLDALKLVKSKGAVPQNINFAIKSSAVEDFIVSNGKDYSISSSSKQLSKADAAELARTFTYRLECMN